MEPVGIEGVSAISAAGVGAAAILEEVLAKRSAIRESPELAALGFKSALVARVEAFAEERWLSGEELAAPRPHRMVLCAARMAIEDAGLGSARGANSALVVGTSSGAMTELVGHLRDPEHAGSREASYFAPMAFAARALGIAGPVQTVSSACASGAIALCLAADLVACGSVDLAIAVGYDAWCDFVHAGFDALGALSPRIPTPFRADRSGLVLGEGAAAVVLRRSAGRRGRLLGAGMSGDARHITAPDREGAGVSRAIRAALADSGRTARDIDLVSAHGTGTVHNDAMESRGIKDALGERAREIPIHTIKPIVGHTLGAAGLIEAVVTLAAMSRRVGPPTLTSDAVDPDCDLDYTTGEPIELPRARTALKLSSGFGGSNAALVLEAP
ncbi:MAG: beta-ketoacyl-[acyl-carrier-protein] synthase family protein [Deltaproteobacteria bacterium]|nr:beta-ketoacyl-[acyl-carrier-protein] synthase family protein [Deltaproteobacteria bacterium]